MASLTETSSTDDYQAAARSLLEQAQRLLNATSPGSKASSSSPYSVDSEEEGDALPSHPHTPPPKPAPASITPKAAPGRLDAKTFTPPPPAAIAPSPMQAAPVFDESHELPAVFSAFDTLFSRKETKVLESEALFNRPFDVFEGNDSHFSAAELMAEGGGSIVGEVPNGDGSFAKFCLSPALEEVQGAEGGLERSVEGDDGGVDVTPVISQMHTPLSGRDQLMQEVREQRQELAKVEQVHAEYTQRSVEKKVKRGEKKVSSPTAPKQKPKKSLDELLAARLTSTGKTGTPSPRRRKNSTSMRSPSRSGSVGKRGGGDGKPGVRTWNKNTHITLASVSSRASSPVAKGSPRNARSVSTSHHSGSTVSPRRTPKAKGDVRAMQPLSTNTVSRAHSYTSLKAQQAQQARLQQQQQQPSPQRSASSTYSAVPKSRGRERGVSSVSAASSLPLEGLEEGEDADYSELQRELQARQKEESGVLIKRMLATADKLHAQRVVLRRLQVWAFDVVFFLSGTQQSFVLSTPPYRTNSAQTTKQWTPATPPSR